MVNNPLIRPYFLGGVGIWGVPLDSHDFSSATRGSCPTAADDDFLVSPVFVVSWGSSVGHSLKRTRAT